MRKLLQAKMGEAAEPDVSQRLTLLEIDAKSEAKRNTTMVVSGNKFLRDVETQS